MIDRQQATAVVGGDARRPDTAGREKHEQYADRRLPHEPSIRPQQYRNRPTPRHLELRHLGTSAHESPPRAMFEHVPLFEYDCLDCGKRFEVLVRKAEEPACPDCQSRRLSRVLSAFGVTTPGTSKSAFDKARQSHR